MRPENVLNPKSNAKTVPIIVSELEVQDIDNETDWKLAEIKYKMMIGEDATHE